MNGGYPLRHTESGMIFMDREDNCDYIVDVMLISDYSEEFCISLDWDPIFISNLMKAGFLVMSATYSAEEENPVSAGGLIDRSIDLVLPKLHLVRSVLFFKDLHIKKSIKPSLPRYELRFDTDFNTIVNKCIEAHGKVWLTPSLIKSIFSIRQQTSKLPAPLPSVFPQPVSFGLYRDGKLTAGEFGIICGRVYTSYSGFKEENNSGTVQMILMVRTLEEAGFDFLDFGMPLDYKTDLGAKNLKPEQFVNLFRSAQI